MKVTQKVHNDMKIGNEKKIVKIFDERSYKSKDDMKLLTKRKEENKQTLEISKFYCR